MQRGFNFDFKPKQDLCYCVNVLPQQTLVWIQVFLLFYSLNVSLHGHGTSDLTGVGAWMTACIALMRCSDVSVSSGAHSWSRASASGWSSESRSLWSQVHRFHPDIIQLHRCSCDPGFHRKSHINVTLHLSYPLCLSYLVCTSLN